MRRFTANSLVGMLLALFLAPAALLADSQKICCRRAGMHHCDAIGSSVAAETDSQASFNNNGPTCPMRGCAITAHAKFGIAAFQSSFRHAQTEDFVIPKSAFYSASLLSANLRDRGPPSLLLE